jgi:hypothetical protein
MLEWEVDICVEDINSPYRSVQWLCHQHNLPFCGRLFEQLAKKPGKYDSSETAVVSVREQGVDHIDAHARYAQH